MISNSSEFIRVRPSLSEFVRVRPSLSEFIRIMKGGGALNRIGFMVLSILRQSEAVNKFSSMTVREIAEMESDFGLKENTVSKKAREFEKAGFVKRGLKEGRADTFYITPEGLNLLEKERNEL